MLRDAFDIVIIEAPSMDKLNKSREWIVLADKVLSVFSSGSTLKNSKLQNMQYFHEIGEDVFAGWVLNKVVINRLNKLPK